MCAVKYTIYSHLFKFILWPAENASYFKSAGSITYIDEMLLRMTWTVGRSVCQVFPLETPSFPHADYWVGLEIQGRECNEESKSGVVMSHNWRMEAQKGHRRF